MKLTCFIRSEGNYLPVELKDCKVTNVGRSVETRIRSASVSRNQLEIIPNFDKRIATVKQLGPNGSAVNGEVIGQGLYVVAKEGDVININAENEEFNYRLCFEEKEEDEIIGHDTKTVNGRGDHGNKGDGNPKPVKIPKMFMTKSQRAADFKKDNLMPKGTWEDIDSGKVLVYVSSNAMKEAKSTICAFDMDGTIITTKSGRVFPKDDDDWKFLYDSTVAKLQRLGEEANVKLVVVTNQAGIEKGSTKISTFKVKIENIVRQIGVPMLVFVLPKKNEYRKPLPMIWNLLVRSYCGGVSPDMTTSYYCGDAAGRKKDHSKVDRLFAINIGLPFFTPEELFLGQKPQPFNMPTLDPKCFLHTTVSNDHITFPHKLELIVLVGFPGAGKTEFFKSVLAPKAYVHVNRDTLKTAAKCKSSAESALQSGMSVVIDNTNPTKKDREEYLKIAQKNGVPSRCFVMKVDHVHAMHNNRFRELTSSDHAKIPDVVFNTYKSRYQEPSDSEGFNEIVHVNFVPRFDSEDRKKVYCLYLLEK